MNNKTHRMKRYFPLHLIMTVALTLCVGHTHVAAFGRAGNVTAMVLPGWQNVQVTGGGSWIGLYCLATGASTAQLRRCSVMVGPKMSEDEPHSGKRNIIIKPDSGMVFAVRGLARLRPGRVLTSYYEQPTQPDCFKRDFRMSRTNYQIIMSHTPQMNGEPGHDDVILRSGRREQVLETVNQKYSAIPVWVGDLEGDGKPDVYVEEEFNGGRGANILYLSSLAHKGELVRKAVDYVYSSI